jgi:hypothetical protein
MGEREMRVRFFAAVAASSFWLATGALAVEPPASSAPPAPSAPASDAQPAPHHLDKCPNDLADYDNSDATMKLVQKCLGRPATVMPGRDSDVIWMYSARGGTIQIVFVFDKSGAMTHFRVYAKN